MITGCLRVKDECRWIQRVIASMLPVCDRIAVFDDHSTDGTPFLCAGMPRTTVYDSPFCGLNEARDKNYLLDKVRRDSDWILMLDGDELLTPESIPHLLAIPASAQCVSFRIWYLWNDEQTVRVDGVYGNFRRQSMFRPGVARFHEGSGPNFHCGKLDRADRSRKYEWYRKHDPDVGTPRDTNDGYSHMVTGDLFSAGAKFRHGGPLELRSL
jgi:glycosyltransferase involved in cell wall biosynthesis